LGCGGGVGAFGTGGEGLTLGDGVRIGMVVRGDADRCGCGEIGLGGAAPRGGTDEEREAELACGLVFACDV